jgi:hypothetical protein
MLNKSGITKTTAVNVNQILLNVEHQVSVGCVVKKDISAIVPAGTPIKIDLKNLQTPAEIADADIHEMNAVLLHDVDARTANANGTALIFGFVNLNRLASDVEAKIVTALTNASASKLITFVKA